MTNSIISLYSSSVRERRDKQITKLYKKFIPKSVLENIEKNFDIETFKGKFTQVATSRSTVIARTGITFSNVQATYGVLSDEAKKNRVSVLNQGLDGNFNFTSIIGESRPRIDDESKAIPGCRTVYFQPNERYQDQNFDNGFEGDYWILYATEDMSTIIVGIPLILFGRMIKSNIGVYVLTKDPENFWKNEELRNKVMYYITQNPVFNPEKNPAKLSLQKPFQSWYNKPFATALTYDN